jgi:hypothetical protein
MFLYASSALPGVVQRAMAYVFPRAQSNVLFMFSVTYLCIVMIFLVG